MGFSVSSAAAIVFISLFVVVGMVFSAASNSTEKVNDAKRAMSDNHLGQENTGLEIVSKSWDGSTLTLEVNNTGAEAMSLDQAELLVDNDHVPQSSFAVLTVDGQSDTDLWLPGETLHVEVSLSETPSRVKVVGAHGVADAEVI